MLQSRDLGYHDLGYHDLGYGEAWMTERLRCHITVAAIIPGQNRFLFVEEMIQGVRVLNQPAGHLDPGEDLVQAVIREVREETCLEFTPEAWLGCDMLALDDGAVSLRVAFTGTVGNSWLDAKRDPSILDLHWLEPSSPPPGLIWRSPLVLRSIQRFEAGIRLPLDSVGRLIAGT
jgi:8-oxo-dGTP pyrophosphatase MutT (NUDIX family)